MYLPQLVKHTAHMCGTIVFTVQMLLHHFFFLENEKVPDYKTVSIKNDVNVKDFYNVEDRLGA